MKQKSRLPLEGTSDQPVQKPKRNFLKSLFPWKGDPVREVIRKIILLIALCTFLGSSGTLLYQLVYLPCQSDKVTGDLRSLYPGNKNIFPQTENSSGSAPSSAPVTDEQGRLQKFSALLKINPDIKGWITIPNTQIDYPVLQSSADDPEYYLYRNYNKENTKYGSIFMDAHSELGVDSKNLILHGHHMHDGRMFANLMNFSDLNFYKSTPTFTFDTIYEESTWKVIAIIKTNTLGDQGQPFPYLRGSFSSTSDFLNYVYQVRVRSLIHSPVDITDSDQLITLSTCSYEFADFRTAVIARKLRPGESPAVNTDSAQLNPNPLMPDIWYQQKGGSPPAVTTFEQALAAGQIDWYTAPNK